MIEVSFCEKKNFDHNQHSTEGREPWARECVTWPRYRDSEFVLGDGPGESMLELTTEEQRALQFVSLGEVRKETYGGADHYNWKKGRAQPRVLPERARLGGEFADRSRQGRLAVPPREQRLLQGT